MANNYKNAAVVLTSTGATDLYTCPSGRTAIVQSVNVANVDSSNRDVTVTLYDSSVATSYTVIYNATIPVGVSMNALSTPLVLEPGDIVRVQASAANTLHATASVLEQDATSIHVDGSITNSKIADDAVTADKLAPSLSATTICTSSTRPASPFEGQKIYETNTNKEYVYNGLKWTGASGPAESIAHYWSSISATGFSQVTVAGTPTAVEHDSGDISFDTSTGWYQMWSSGLYVAHFHCSPTTGSPLPMTIVFERTGTMQHPRIAQSADGSGWAGYTSVNATGIVVADGDRTMRARIFSNNTATFAVWVRIAKIADL